MTNINLESIQEHYKPFFKKIYYNENHIILLFLSIVLLYFNPYLYFCILVAHGMFYINFETFDFNIKLNVKKDDEIETKNPLFDINKDNVVQKNNFENVEIVQSKLYNLVNLLVKKLEEDEDKEEKVKENDIQDAAQDLINNSKKFLTDVLKKTLENLNKEPHLDVEGKLLLKKTIEDNLKKIEETETFLHTNKPFDVLSNTTDSEESDNLLVHPLQ